MAIKKIMNSALIIGLFGIVSGSGQLHASDGKHCHELKKAIKAADAVLESNEIIFDGIGDLTTTIFVSFYTGNPGPFNLLNSTLQSVSDGEISYANPSDAYDDIGACKLFDDLVKQIAD